MVGHGAVVDVEVSGPRVFGVPFLFEHVAVAGSGGGAWSAVVRFLPCLCLLVFGAGECFADGVVLEPEVDPDGCVVGELLFEVREDRPEAGRIGR